jgi:hypothetical protein
MADVETVRAKKKLAAARRAEFRLRQRLEAIDWELDTLAPEVAELEAAGTRGFVIDSTIVEIAGSDGD